MITKTSQSGHVTYGLQEFMIDTVDDLNHLPIDAPMGSTAFCIETSSVYVLNGKGEWKEV